MGAELQFWLTLHEGKRQLDKTKDSPWYKIKAHPAGFKEFVDERQALWNVNSKVLTWDENERRAAKKINKRRCKDRLKKENPKLTAKELEDACEKEADTLDKAAREPGKGGSKKKDDFYENPGIE